MGQLLRCHSIWLTVSRRSLLVVWCIDPVHLSWACNVFGSDQCMLFFEGLVCGFFLEDAGRNTPIRLAPRALSFRPFSRFRTKNEAFQIQVRSTLCGGGGLEGVEELLGWRGRSGWGGASASRKVLRLVAFHDSSCHHFFWRFQS